MTNREETKRAEPGADNRRLRVGGGFGKKGHINSPRTCSLGKTLERKFRGYRKAERDVRDREEEGS